MKRFRKMFRLSLAGRQAWTGRLFVMPFYIGFAAFFAIPLLQSFMFVFQTVTVQVQGFETEFIGFANLVRIFTEDLDYSTNLMTTTVQVLWQVPVVLIASIFIAMLLNTKFKGRTFVRAVFFLPVIIVTGAVINIMNMDSTAAAALTGNVAAAGQIQYSSGIEDFLFSLGLPMGMTIRMVIIANSMYNVLWMTGVQVILLLAGLQSVSPALYEASAIEGATPWENFFKITLPMLMPIIAVTTVYTVVDSFMDSNNAVMNQVLHNAAVARFTTAASMAWTYLVIIAVVLTAVFLLFSRINKKLG
jgi:ABC-type sugar transport system permease subunit